MSLYSKEIDYSRYNLAKEQLDWFFPESRKNPNWEYKGPYLGAGNEADRQFLDKRLPKKNPPDGYFQDEELDMLLGRSTPLRYPPIYYISVTRLGLRLIKNCLEQNWRENSLFLGDDIHGSHSQLVNRYTITVFNDENIPALVKELSENLNGLLRISVDAYYSTVSEQTTLDDNGETVVAKEYSIIYPNTWGSVNDTEMLRNEEDLDNMISELSPDAFADKLVKNTFHRRDVFRQSNVRLHRILAYQLIVNTYPPAWLAK